MRGRHNCVRGYSASARSTSRSKYASRAMRSACASYLSLESQRHPCLLPTPIPAPSSPRPLITRWTRTVVTGLKRCQARVHVLRRLARVRHARHARRSPRPLLSPRDVGVCESRSRVYPRRPTASGRSRYALDSAALHSSGSHHMPCLLLSVLFRPSSRPPSAAVAAAVATAAAWACAAFFFAWSRSRPSKPHAAPRHPAALPPLALLPAATFSDGYCIRCFFAPSRSFALTTSHP
jgi:hypothetical protein